MSPLHKTQECGQQAPLLYKSPGMQKHPEMRMARTDSIKWDLSYSRTSWTLSHFALMSGSVHLACDIALASEAEVVGMNFPNPAQRTFKCLPDSTATNVFLV